MPFVTCGIRNFTFTAILASLSPWLAGIAVASAADAPPSGFSLQRLAPGVFAAIRREPPGLLEHANSLVVIGDHDVTVVDAQMTRAASAQLAVAISRLTPKPVRHVVNTHWHDDHVFGNAAFAAAWPGVEFIATARTGADLATLGARNRKDFLAQLPDEVGMLRHALEAGMALNAHDLSQRGRPLDAAARASYQSDIAQAGDYLAAAPDTPVVLPERILAGELVLGSGRNAVHLLELGAAHTCGDLVAWLPGPGVLATGDAASAIVPMAAPTADLAHWQAQLARLQALHPRFLVPGHGPVQRGDALLLRTQALLAAVRGRARAAYQPGMSAAQLQQAVSLEDYQRRWAGDDSVRQFLFSNFFEQPALAAAWGQLSGQPACVPAA